MNDKKRFEQKYIKLESGCWEWTGWHDRYGFFWYKSRQVLAHRFSYMLYIGDIPISKQVNHKCSNRLCVNPAHLYLGSQYDNVQDAISMGTHCSLLNSGNRFKNQKGTNNYCSKLTVDDVIQIKKMLRDGIKQWLIAWTFKVNRSNIGKIKRGERWNHITI